MKDLSKGVLMAWQIAAIETAAAKYQYIEKEQILIGILSLEKSLTLKNNVDPLDLNEIKIEYEMIEKILKRFKLNSIELRRKIREKKGKGNYIHTEKVIHRSKECKKLFILADTFAENSEKITSPHLFAAVMEDSSGIIPETLKSSDIDPIELKSRALFFSKSINKSGKSDSYFI